MRKIWQFILKFPECFEMIFMRIQGEGYLQRVQKCTTFLRNSQGQKQIPSDNEHIIIDTYRKGK